MGESSTKELAAERQARLRELLHERRVVRVEEFASELAVSAATVRRDLAALESAGGLKRVHGGAVATAETLLADEPLFDDKAERAALQKRRIADAALELLPQGHTTLFLDGGSTVLALALLLMRQARHTVVTNSLRVAQTLAASGPQVIVSGGELRRLSQTFVGPQTRHVIERLSFDIAFIGTLGVTADDGLTTTDPDEAYTKELAIKRARRVVLLADATKVGAVSTVRFAPLSSVNTFVTDTSVPQRSLAALREAYPALQILTV
ncbi:MAG: DeoR/GlpR transcriptional regulator [Lentisphaerae bacterium]|jgi:DeoR family fructose operon transcriptional repressor|nr:DeoR/GlpR transcriptional regulator [Lentisphaerota bacterium]